MSKWVFFVFVFVIEEAGSSDAVGVGVRERHGYAFNENKEERRGVFIISEQVEGGLETSIGAFMILRIYIDMEGDSF